MNVLKLERSKCYNPKCILCKVSGSCHTGSFKIIKPDGSEVDLTDYYERALKNLEIDDRECSGTCGGNCAQYYGKDYDGAFEIIGVDSSEDDGIDEDGAFEIIGLDDKTE